MIDDVPHKQSYGQFGTANPVPEELQHTIVHEYGPRGPKESERPKRSSRQPIRRLAA